MVSADNFDRFELVMRTLESFDVVATVGVGAVLYPRRWRTSALPTNLHAALAAASLGLSSLDYARKTYADEGATAEDPAEVEYLRAFFEARDYMHGVKGRLQTTSRSRDHLGTFAASIALQRLESGFRATHFMYRLGMNVEGDALARQFLEQVAWAFAAAPFEDLDRVDRVSATKAITALKSVLPEVGHLYGRLSDIAHAGLAQHQRLVQLGLDDEPHVVLAEPRFLESAEVLLTLADAWVVVCETTQRDHLDVVSALRSLDDPAPNPDRAFKQVSRELLGRIRDAQRDGEEPA